MSGKDNFIHFYLIFKTLCFVSARVVQFILASVLACNLNSNIQFFWLFILNAQVNHIMSKIQTKLISNGV